jgi:hypothetical protein
VAVAQQLSGNYQRNKSSTTWVEADDRKMSMESVVNPSMLKKDGAGGKRKESRLGRKNSFGSVSSIGSRFNPAGQPQADITRMVATDDYMSDVNVKSMRRLMNVVYVMSRLMRAFHIDFNWSHLANWVYKLTFQIFPPVLINKVPTARRKNFWSVSRNLSMLTPLI